MSFTHSKTWKLRGLSFWVPNVAFRRFLFFNQGYYIEVISKTFSSYLTLTHFLIFLQPLKNSCLCFFLLDQKVGLTVRNHSTYPKLQSIIHLKLFVLEPIKENKNNYFRGWGRYKKIFLKSRFFKLTLSKYCCKGGSNTTLVKTSKL